MRAEFVIDSIQTELELLRARLEKTHDMNWYSECSDEFEVNTVQVMTVESLRKGMEEIDRVLKQLEEICPDDDDDEDQVEAEPTNENLSLEATAQAQA